jgi:hypothetical protein
MYFGFGPCLDVVSQNLQIVAVTGQSMMMTRY